MGRAEILQTEKHDADILKYREEISGLIAEKRALELRVQVEKGQAAEQNAAQRHRHARRIGSARGAGSTGVATARVRRFVATMWLPQIENAYVGALPKAQRFKSFVQLLTAKVARC